MLLAQTSGEACLCTPGFTQAFNVCSACAPGRYKNFLGNDMCLECDTAQYNPFVQATTCVSCALATENNESFDRALVSESNNISLMHISLNFTVMGSNSTKTQDSISVYQCVCDSGQEPIREKQPIFSYPRV